MLNDFKDAVQNFQPYSVCALSTVSFFAFNRLSGYRIPHIVESSASRIWKWKNIVTSFLHSILTGIGSIYCFFEVPKLAEDMIETYTKSGHLLLSISIGYFIYDFLDMVFYNRNRSSYELMAHHCFVLMCLGISTVLERYIGYAVAALVVEINSIFLHFRQLLLLLGFKKTDTIYRSNSFINMGTFIVFRVVTLAWMTRWLVLHRNAIPLPEYTCAAVGLSAVFLMSIVLFFRLLQSDFVPQNSKKGKADQKSSFIKQN